MPLWKEDAWRDADRRWRQDEEAAEAGEDRADMADLHKHAVHGSFCCSASAGFTSRVCREICSRFCSSLTYFSHFLLCCLDERKPSHRGAESARLHGAASCTATWRLPLQDHRDPNGGRRDVVTGAEVGGGEKLIRRDGVMADRCWNVGVHFNADSCTC